MTRDVLLIRSEVIVQQAKEKGLDHQMLVKCVNAKILLKISPLTISNSEQARVVAENLTAKILSMGIHLETFKNFLKIEDLAFQYGIEIKAVGDRIKFGVRENNCENC